jgi:eukaryotic-like serine/threonine-protein kinase
VTLKALAKDADDRYQSAREMKADITRVLAGQQATAVVPRVREEATAATRAVPMMAGGAATQVAPPVPPPTAMAPEGLATHPADPDEEEERKPRVGLAVAITAAIILVLGLGAYALYSILTPDTPTVQTVAVPNVLTFPQKLAVEQLEGSDLKAEIKKVNGKDDETKGTVTEQNPVADTPVDPGSTVTITVNVGPETGKIPTNLKGKSKDEVREQLEDAGFTNVDLKEAEQEDPDTDPDEVISVSPKEGTTVAKEAKITVTYATGKSPVPNFSGLSEDRAREDAKTAGFDEIEVVEEESNEHPVGTVIRQNPEAGKVVDRTQPIRLVIAKAVPQPTPTPVPPSTPPVTPTPTPSVTPS